MDDKQLSNLSQGTSPEPEQVGELDEHILWELIRDGRITITALATLLGVSPSTVSARVSALKRTGVLKSVHAEVDLRRVGLPVQAMVFVSGPRHVRT